MISKTKRAWKPLKNVLTTKKYFIIFLFIAFTFFSISILSKNFKTIINLSKKLSLTESFSFIISLYKGGIVSNSPHSTIILVTISILLGALVSLMFFKIDSNKSIKGSLTKSGTVGAFLGVATPVCAPCGIGLLSLVGLGSVLAFLPYKGTELGVLSIGLLYYSLVSVGNDIDDCKSCKIEINKNKKK